MTVEHEGHDSDFGNVLFCCRRKSVWRFLRVLNQAPREKLVVLRAIGKFGEIVMPCLSPFLFAGNLWLVTIALPLSLLKIEQGIMVREIALVLFAVIFIFCIWWYWLSPGKDYLVVCENGFRWRVWLSKMKLLPSKGSVSMNSLSEFHYRSDWVDNTKPIIPPNATTAEKFTNIIIELALSKREVVLKYTNGSERVVENLLARFDEDDIKRFLDHLAKNGGCTLVSV